MLAKKTSGSGGRKMINGSYTVLGAAAILGVIPETVRRYIRDDKLPARMERVKGLREILLIDPKDLEQFRQGG